MDQYQQNEAAQRVAMVESIARHYRRLVMLVGIQILFGIVINAELTNVALAAVIGVASLVCAVLMVITAYRLATQLKTGVPVLWAIGMFVPCVNILVLLMLSSRA